MVTYRCGSGREPRPESRLQATLRGCENDRLRINHTMRMPAKIGLKHDCLRLLFQRRCGVQLRQRSDGAIPSNLPPSLVAASSDKSSQSVSPHSRDRLAPHNDAPQIHFGQVSNSTSSHSRDALPPVLCLRCEFTPSPPFANMHVDVEIDRADASLCRAMQAAFMPAALAGTGIADTGQF